MILEDLMKIDKKYLKHYTDEGFMRAMCQEKSGYYVRSKGFRDGKNVNLNPPAKQGYFFDEYMLFYRTALVGLPF